METLEIFLDCEGNADGAVSPFWVSKKGTRESIFTDRPPPAYRQGEHPQEPI